MLKTVYTRWRNVLMTPLSTILTEDDLLNFQQRCTDRIRNYPAVKTLSLFLRQVASEEKSCRKALIADAANQTALNNKRLTVLKRPACPTWMSQAFYEQYTPKELTVRAIKTKKRIIVTTLFDEARYTRAEISALYQKRWHVELDFRAIKTLMKMAILRCKSPDMVRKEISVHLLAYNLLRALMARTAQMTGQSPREISFRAAQQTLRDFHIILLTTDDLAGIVGVMLGIMAEHQVGDRSERPEPRAVKRQPKAFPKLQHSRTKARQLTKYQGKAA